VVFITKDISFYDFQFKNKKLYQKKNRWIIASGFFLIFIS